MGPARESATDQPAMPQFSLRSVLLVLTAVAVGCAVVAPLVRSLSIEQRIRLGWIVLAVVGGAVASASNAFVRLLHRRRKRNEQVRGARLLAIGYPFPRLGMAFELLNATLNSAVACLMAYMWIRLSSDLLVVAIVSLVTAACAGWRSSQAIMHRWLDADWLEFCQNGIVVGHSRFQRWDEIVGYRWSSNRRALRLVLPRKVLELRVPESVHGSIDRILVEHVHHRGGDEVDVT